MDRKRNDKYIEQKLREMGIDVEEARLRTETAHLLTLFEQGKTLKEALETVGNGQMRAQLQPYVYCSTIHALILAVARLGFISPEQFQDLEGYLLTSTNARLAHRPM